MDGFCIFLRIKEILITELENIDEFGSLILEAIEEFNDKEFISLIEKQIVENKKLKKVEESWLLKTLEKLKETEKNINYEGFAYVFLQVR